MPARFARSWLREALGGLAIATIAVAPAADAGHSILFNGTGSGNVDRIAIRVDDPVTTTPGPHLDVGAADFTIDLWVKGVLADNAAPAVTCGVNVAWINGNVVLDRDRYNQDRKFGLSFANGHAVFGVSGNGTGDLTLCGASNVLDGTWHHIAVQRRRSDGYLWLFVDGTLEAKGDGPDGDVSYPDDGVPSSFCGGPCVNDSFLVIGAEKHDVGVAFPSFKGYVDEVRISTMLRYPYANFPRPVAPFVADSATNALYHFDEGRGDRLFDAMPKATGATDGEIRRATPAGYPLWSIDTPFTGLGAIGASTVWLSVADSTSMPAVDVATPPDTSGELFILDQQGRVRMRHLRNGSGTSAILDITSKTTGAGEQGLLGLAFHPDYAYNGFIYVAYTRNGDGALVVERYGPRYDLYSFDPASARTLLVVPHPGHANHNGGKLAFGIDGYLYIGTGDGGGSNDPDDNARRTVNNLGKMLRIDVDSVAAAPWYSIPPTNPYAGSTCDGTSGACPEIWALGMRNPWRFSFDRLTGDLFIGDVGQGAREEVNLEPAGTPGGRNYGWRTIEGTICTQAYGSPCPPPPNYTPPIFDYDRTLGSSITGGVRYRGSRIPALAGAYVYGDFVSQRIWAATTDGQGAWTAQQQLVVAPEGISSFGEDVDGELFVTGYSGNTYRIEPADTDNDGLPDWWEAAYFGSATGSAPATDSDGDRFTNVEEYRAGTDPRLATSRPIRREKPRDLNASGAADLVWRNAATGDHAVWLMRGATMVAGTVPLSGMSLQVTHTGDLNADGRHDLLFHDAATGETRALSMDGTRIWRVRRFFTDRNSKVTHVADFVGTGRSDPLWRNEVTGATSMLLDHDEDGSNFIVLLVDATWKVTHVADFNGDGKADLLWRNDGTGETAIWLMSGSTYLSGSVILGIANWRVELAGDFDGDGREDLVWRNASTGDVALWLMDGTTMTAGAIVLANSSWSPTHLADLDGDGRKDILWRNTSTGETNAWLMNGLAFTLGGGITNAGYVVVTTGDFDGDGRDDIVWHNASLGATQLRLMDGLSMTAWGDLLLSPVWTVIP